MRRLAKTEKGCSTTIASLLNISWPENSLPCFKSPNDAAESSLNSVKTETETRNVIQMLPAGLEPGFLSCSEDLQEHIVETYLPRKVRRGGLDRAFHTPLFWQIGNYMGVPLKTINDDTTVSVPAGMYRPDEGNFERQLCCPSMMPFLFIGRIKGMWERFARGKAAIIDLRIDLQPCRRKGLQFFNC